MDVSDASLAHAGVAVPLLVADEDWSRGQEASLRGAQAHQVALRYLAWPRLAQEHLHSTKKEKHCDTNRIVVPVCIDTLNEQAVSSFWVQ